MKSTRRSYPPCVLESLESRVLLSACPAVGIPACLPAAVPGADTMALPLAGYYAAGPATKNIEVLDAGTANNAGPGAAPAATIATPTMMGVKAIGPNAVYLSWSYSGVAITGFNVYRSVNGGAYTRIGSVGGSVNTAADLNAPANANCSYRVAAYKGNSTSGQSNALPVTTPADYTIKPASTQGSITTRYGGELVIAGSTGKDMITVDSAGNITITSTGNTVNSKGKVTGTYSNTATGTIAGATSVFIYSYGGTDTITVNSGVTLPITIATVDGAGTTITNGDPSASIWVDSTDTYTGGGSIHTVNNYYGNVSKAAGINIAEPIDAGTTFRAGGSLWGSGPVMNDVNQTSIGDCYFLASLAAFANSCPAKLENMAVDLGDGTYVVQYQRGGVSSYVRVDGDIKLGGWDGYYGARPANTGSTAGDLWALIFEKSYAYFRTGRNSYASLNGGWPSDVYSDFGIANTNPALTSDAGLYSAVANALATGKPVTFATYVSSPDLVGNHVYTLYNVYTDAGGTHYQVRNPWGVQGDYLEDANGYATLTYDQILANFQLCTMAV
jgi:hypothetical protein